ncbi:hypothetical protein M7I_3789 [Glarea lozoyensis 74030]|uniref:Uncharacterized protein n=1 Tax=Glarea lozoyensis (strain ATCC 74030 / MF5533) TaxID=1104152 RepID=H0EMF3_GLAL7|nr:hypothetical protein M7I_3789 [Glarea lozoyensis 74030]
MAYEYDEYGRLRGNGESAFFEPSHPIPEHYPTTDYYSDSRDNIPRRPDDRQRASPLKQNRAQKMSTTSMDSDSSEHVSAETIAAITERIKQEAKLTEYYSKFPIERELKGLTTEKSYPQ